MIEDFLKFLKERSRTFEMLESNKAKQEAMTPARKKNEKQVALAITSQTFSVCKGNHCIYNCAEFLKKSVPNRHIEIRKTQLCIHCLKPGHYVKDCKSTSCRKYTKAHNTLLHSEPTESQQEQATSQGSQQSEDTTKLDNTRCNVISCEKQKSGAEQVNVNQLSN